MVKQAGSATFAGNAAIKTRKCLTNRSLGFCGRGAGFRGNDLGFCGRPQDFAGTLRDFAGGGQNFAGAVQDNAGGAWISREPRRLGGNEAGFRGRSAGFYGSVPEPRGNDLGFGGNGRDLFRFRSGGLTRRKEFADRRAQRVGTAWSASGERVGQLG